MHAAAAIPQEARALPTNSPHCQRPVQSATERRSTWPSGTEVLGYTAIRANCNKTKKSGRDRTNAAADATRSRPAPYTPPPHHIEAPMRREREKLAAQYGISFHDTSGVRVLKRKSRIVFPEFPESRISSCAAQQGFSHPDKARAHGDGAAVALTVGWPQVRMPLPALASEPTALINIVAASTWQHHLISFREARCHSFPHRTSVQFHADASVCIENRLPG